MINYKAYKNYVEEWLKEARMVKFFRIYIL